MPFFKTSPSLEQQLAEVFVERGGLAPGRLDFLFGREVPGRMTGLKCWCGGSLQEVRALAEVPLPPKPTHKKRRILKKRMRRWEQAVGVRARISAALLAAQIPVYRCMSCERKHGFYSVMARNMFRVAQLPDGALPIYDKDPDVTAFIVGEEA